MTIESDLFIACSPCLLCEINIIIKMLADVNFTGQKATENNLEAPEVDVVTH